MGKMRATNHNARGGKDGAFSAKHNDRDFELKNATHIDSARQNQNWYWHCYQSAHPELTFELAEKRFYDQYFAAGLDAKNERYIKQRHKERCQTMDEYRRNMKTCPEETIMAIGSLEDGTVRPEVLHDICMKQLLWEQKAFPNVHILDCALHADEEGVPHFQARKVWVALDKDGNKIVNQNEALKAMGIERPDPEKKKSRYNNAKMTYSAMCRNHLLELCRERGLDIEVIPKEASKSGKSMIQYQADQERKKAEQIVQEAKEEAASIIAGAESRAYKIIEESIVAMEMDRQELDAEKAALDAEKAEIARIKAKLTAIIDRINPALEAIRATVKHALTEKITTRPYDHDKIPFEATPFGLVSRFLRFKSSNREMYPLFDFDRFVQPDKVLYEDLDGKWQSAPADYVPAPEDWLPTPPEESIRMIDQAIREPEMELARPTKDLSR